MNDEAVKHPADAAIRAWLDGKSIQWQNPGFKWWVDVAPIGPKNISLPFFGVQTNYRIKPEPIILRYKVAIYYSGFHWMSVVKPDRYEEVERLRDFVRWDGEERVVTIEQEN